MKKYDYRIIETYYTDVGTYIQKSSTANFFPSQRQLSKIAEKYSSRKAFEINLNQRTGRISARIITFEIIPVEIAVISFIFSSYYEFNLMNDRGLLGVDQQIMSNSLVFFPSRNFGQICQTKITYLIFKGYRQHVWLPNLQKIVQFQHREFSFRRI